MSEKGMTSLCETAESESVQLKALPAVLITLVNTRPRGVMWFNRIIRRTRKVLRGRVSRDSKCCHAVTRNSNPCKAVTA